MSTFVAAFKEEVSRLAKKEAKAATELLKKDNARLKHDSAAFKRQIRSLETEVRRIKSLLEKFDPETPSEEEVDKARISAKGIISLRRKLGISQTEFAQLAGVHKQSVYLWESGKTLPRGKTKAAVIALRGLGAREARRRLEEME